MVLRRQRIVPTRSRHGRALLGTASLRRGPALCGPGQQHDLAANSTPVDAGMDLSSCCERQSLDHDRLNGASAQQLEQHGHVGLKFLRVCRSTGRYAVEDGATAAEEEADCAPQL